MSVEVLFGVTLILPNVHIFLTPSLPPPEVVKVS